MQPKNLICVVVDRLHAGMIGAYGNSWIHTSQLDHLASQSFLFDQAFVSNPQLEALYRAYWLGLKPADGNQSSAALSFPRLLGAVGIHTALITDEPDVAHLTAAADFATQQLIESTAPAEAAADVWDAQMARLFSAAIAWLESAPQPFCLWLHARGMGAAWDAPWQLRNQYTAEEDPEPTRFVEVPDRRLSQDSDPDELLGIVHAYAGQISLLDACLGALIDHLQQGSLSTITQLTLLSARGFALGEHGRVGPHDEALYNETVQVPWLMRFPDGLGNLARSQALVESADLPATLLDWLEIDRGSSGWGHAASLLEIVRGRQESIRDRIFLQSQHDRAIRTLAWMMRHPDGGPVELYSKPSDRWEVNEVANLCPRIVEGLDEALTHHDRADHLGQPPLAEDLVRQID